tara:strand:+ start:555 stop:1064 length:510 start_codon:yes stop_codon:yes gene_type:complete
VIEYLQHDIARAGVFRHVEWRCRSMFDGWLWESILPVFSTYTAVPNIGTKCTAMTDGDRKAKAVGINHVALEVDDVDEALAFYGRFLDFEVTSRNEDIAFIYFGDQFINFTRGRRQGPDDKRHFGIAVDDKELVRERLIEMGVELIDSRFLDFLDPWGNRVEITTYTNI